MSINTYPDEENQAIQARFVRANILHGTVAEPKTVKAERFADRSQELPPLFQHSYEPWNEQERQRWAKSCE